MNQTFPMLLEEEILFLYIKKIVKFGVEKAYS